jgi:3-phenylpropionate/trans-cinnamate dioxygenase ferredoxin subunit
MTTPHHIALSSLQFNEHNIAVTELDGRSICIAKYRDEYHAFLNRCPHATAPLDNGFIDALGFIVCPLHRYRFSIKNGRDSNNEGYRMKVYPVEIQNDTLIIRTS